MNNAPNHPSGNPGGRRGRRGRRGKRGPGQGGPQQHNKGGQRGSQNRGNSNNNHGGIYSAPMDHSYRAALNGNAPQGRGRQQRGRPGFGGAQYVHPEPEPLPATDTNAEARIFCYVDDLFFLAKIQEVARKLNVKVEFVKTDKDILDRAAQNGEFKPALVIVDLNNANIKPLTLVSKLKSKFKKGTNVIGFLSHVQGELKLKAQEAGCDMVVPRSAFSQNLPSLLRRHAATDDYGQA